MDFLDLIGILVGAILTLLVFSYLIHDTFLFRLAQALFVGVGLGYGSSLIIHRVILQGIIQPAVDELSPTFFVRLATLEVGAWLRLLLLLLAFLLAVSMVVFNLYKRGEFATVVGNMSLAYLFGVGAALALVGALSGTLVPQLQAATNLPSISSGDVFGTLNGLLILFGTLGALLAFRFASGFQSQPLSAYAAVAYWWGRIGRGFIFIALGALFASAFIARVSVLISQIYFLAQVPRALSALLGMGN